MNKQKKKDELQGSIASITLLSLVQLAFLIPLGWGIFTLKICFSGWEVCSFPSIWLSILSSSGMRSFTRSMWWTAWRRTTPFEREVYP